MKQLKQISVVASGLIAFAASVVAAPPESVEALMSGGLPPTPEDFSSEIVNRQFASQQTMDFLRPSGQFSLTSPGEELSVRTSYSRPLRSPRKGSLKTVADLKGNYVMTCKSLLSSSYGDTGQSADITIVEGTDSILITNFWSLGMQLKACVDPATGKVTIPNQVVGQMTDNGPIDIAFCNTNGTPDRKKGIEGYVDDEGKINITSWWGIYVMSGINKDRYAYVGNATVMERSNARMSFSFSNGQKADFGVIVRQPYKNRLQVVNFGNYGMTVNINLNTNKGGVIPSQVARQYPQNADFITCSVDEFTDGGLKGLHADIVLNQATDSRTLSWGKWTAVSQGKQNLFFGAIIDGRIVCDNDITYPVAATGEWQGTGTQSDPYRIRTPEDFVLLSDRVNSVPDSELTEMVDGIKCCRMYVGKYFRMENDIDMGGFLFTPVGANLQHRFAGIFDGNGHTVSNLTEDVGTAGMAGLFGMTDSVSVIRNLTLVKPVIRAAGLCAATVAAWSDGLVENCHVREADVLNAGRTAAGLVGLGTEVKNCTVENSLIDGRGGNSAGLAGQIDRLVENCSVTGSDIYTATPIPGYPSGGVVASMNGATGRYLYFSGKVDAGQFLTSPVVGGVAGILSRGTLEKSFAVGKIIGGFEDVNVPNAQPIAGGLVGQMSGSRIEDCYSVGNVSTRLSRMTGGLTGLVRKYDDGKGNVQMPELKNCFTATSIVSETYQYNPETEIRESMGSIADGTELKAENVYYDKQVTNLNSRRHGVLTSVLTSASGPVGFDSSVWNFKEGQYPRLKGIDDNEAASLSGSALVIHERSSMKKLSKDAEVHPLGNTLYRFLVNDTVRAVGRYCSIEDGKLKITEDFGTDTLMVVNGNVSMTFEIKVAPVPFLGEGTATTPYLISSKSDLVALSRITTKVKQYFPETYFLMTNDIDMEYDKDFEGIAADQDAYCKFAGIFDGGNNTVRRIRLDWVVWKDPQPADGEIGTPDDNGSMYNGRKGFIGSLAPEGILRNLNIAADCKFMFWARSAALVGQNEGLVENCRNYADVTCISTNPGGIVGENRKGTILNCYNEGDITSGFNCAGGIVGSNAGKVIGCANAGDVTVKSISSFQGPNLTIFRNAGGIAGESTGGLYEDCVNFGTVFAKNYGAGGISGTLGNVSSSTAVGKNSLRNVINIGMVSAADITRIGALGGVAGTKGEITNAFWDGQIITVKANGNGHLKGAEGINTSVLTSGKTLDGFDPVMWQFDAGMYPVLKRFASEPRIDRARRAVVTMDAVSTARRLRTDAVLAKADGLVWSLSQGKHFTIAADLMKSPGNVESLVGDTLLADFGTYVKSIPIFCPPAVPLAGEGSEEKPYIISTTDDWNSLSDFATRNGEDFTGQFISLASDLDFTEKTFKPLFADGITSFGGTLLGAGHLVKGIDFTAAATFNAPIGVVDVPATVSDLTLEGKVSSTFANTGGFTGKVYGRLVNLVNRVDVISTKASTSAFGYLYSGAFLQNVANEGTITSSSGTLAGIAAMADEGVSFTDVTNKGEIRTTGTSTVTYVGGIVANSMPSSFLRCANNGKFTFSKPEATNGVGGIIGYANSSSARIAAMTLTDCHNTAEITANNYLGGLIGNLNASVSATNPLVLADCSNTADIASVAVKSTTGAGTAGITALYSPGSVIRNCWNTGKIVSSKNTYTAGITAVQKVAPTEALPVLVSGCSNSGDIEANGNQGAGIMATMAAYTTVDSCVNSGNITGGWGLGGIVGSLLGVNARIHACYNTGTIHTSVNRSGGIVAYNQSDAFVSDCINFGAVSTALTEGGTNMNTSGYAIGGIAGYGASEFLRCINLGKVEGPSQVGGILGYTYPKRTKLIDCINLGEIVAPADTCGSIVGADLSNPKMWTAENKTKGCLFITPSSEQKNNSIGKSVCESELASIEMAAGWSRSDNYTYPMPEALTPDTLKVVAARMILVDDESADNVTRDFFVGNPEGVTWTASVPNLTFDGTDARFSSEDYKGEITLTVTAGDHSRSYQIGVNWINAVDAIDVESTVIGELFFTPEGIRCAAPTHKDGKVYLVIRLYENGNRTAEKVLNR